MRSRLPDKVAKVTSAQSAVLFIGGSANALWKPPAPDAMRNMLQQCAGGTLILEAAVTPSFKQPPKPPPKPPPVLAPAQVKAPQGLVSWPGAYQALPVAGALAAYALPYAPGTVVAGAGASQALPAPWPQVVAGALAAHALPCAQGPVVAGAGASQALPAPWPQVAAGALAAPPPGVTGQLTAEMLHQLTLLSQVSAAPGPYMVVWPPSAGQPGGGRYQVWRPPQQQQQFMRIMLYLPGAGGGHPLMLSGMPKAWRRDDTSFYGNFIVISPYDTTVWKTPPFFWLLSLCRAIKQWRPTSQLVLAGHSKGAWWGGLFLKEAPEVFSTALLVAGYSSPQLHLGRCNDQIRLCFCVWHIHVHSDHFHVPASCMMCSDWVRQPEGRVREGAEAALATLSGTRIYVVASITDSACPWPTYEPYFRALERGGACRAIYCDNDTMTREKHRCVQTRRHRGSMTH